MLFFDLFRNDPDLARVASGETLFRAGDHGEIMYVVLDGHVTLARADAAIECLGPGDFFGEVAVLEPGPRGSTVATLTACTLARIDQRRFIEMVENCPDFAVEVIRVMARRLRARHLRTAVPELAAG